MLNVARLNAVMLSVVAPGIRLGTLTLSIKRVAKSSFKKQTNIPKLTPNIGCAFNFKLGQFTQEKHCYCITRTLISKLEIFVKLNVDYLLGGLYYKTFLHLSLFPCRSKLECLSQSITYDIV
jgi:hypothetical protein